MSRGLVFVYWCFGCLLVGGGVFGVSEVSYADNATVLPKGAWQIFSENSYFLPVKDRFNADGDVESLSDPFNVSLAGIISGLPFGADLGRTVAKLELEQFQTKWTPAFGLTDKLSIGVIIPYIWAEANLDIDVDSSTANIGKNSAIASPANPLGLGFPCAALGCGSAADMVAGTSPVNLNDVNALLAANGFKSLKSWRKNGFGDIDVGGRYQYYSSERFRAAFTGAVRFPTGRKDDPDNLVDRGLGEGAYAILFQFQQDFLGGGQGDKDSLGNRLGFPQPGSYYVNTTFEYDLWIPDKEKLRVCPQENPICPTKAVLKRNLGDDISAEISPVIGVFFKGLIFNPQYEFFYHFKNKYSGPSGIPVKVLEENSSQVVHEAKFTLSYTTIPLVIEKKFPVPLVFSLAYRNRFAGESVLKTQFFGFNFTMYGG